MGVEGVKGAEGMQGVLYVHTGCSRSLSLHIIKCRYFHAGVEGHVLYSIINSYSVHGYCIL